MCDLTRPFRLCTCATEADADWTLLREDRSVVARGITLYPALTDDQQITLLYLLEHLAGDCMDFDYRPEDGDRLVFHGADLTVLFSRGAWRHAYDGPAPLQPILHGTVQPVAE
jgi:hypothetical protein